MTGTRVPLCAENQEKMTPRRALIIVSLFLGLGWAVRGHFGHEHGAAWAGAIAAVAIVATAGRRDWLSRLPVLAALAAVGWGAGGMMSYGRIVGFGRADDFANVLYGLSMLGVVGGLYGFIGGGLFGLGIETSEQRRPDWPRILTEMVAGAWLSWGTLIYQLEWFMTPPRSELWAACLGAALALAWYMLRNGFRDSLSVAGYSALGAGFGFAFGNFIQVVGNLSGAGFNWWNVMEFTLGGMGGLAMAYGVFSRSWPEGPAPSRSANWIALLFIVFVVPATNVVQALDTESMVSMAESLGREDPAAFAALLKRSAWLLTIVLAGAGIAYWKRLETSEAPRVARQGIVALSGLAAGYVILSHVRKGLFSSGPAAQPEQLIYWIIFAVSLALFWKRTGPMDATAMLEHGSERWTGWVKRVLAVLAVIALLAAVAAGLHDGIPGAQQRFPLSMLSATN